MPETPISVVVKRPLKARLIRIVCRHARREPGSLTYEFPDRMMLRYSRLGSWRDLYREFPVPGHKPDAAGGPWEPSKKYQYRCPRCHCDLQVREAGMLRLVDALDEVERHRTGDSAARVQRLDISVAVLVLSSFRQAGQSA
jgi:hypothetical protein